MELMRLVNKCFWTTLVGVSALVALSESASLRPSRISDVNCPGLCAKGSAIERAACACLVGSYPPHIRGKRTVDYDFLNEPSSFGSYADQVAPEQELDSPQYSKLFRWGRSGPSVFRWGKRSGGTPVFRWGKRSADTEDDDIDLRMRSSKAPVFPWGKRGGSSKVFRWGKRDTGSPVPVFRWGKRSDVFRWGKRSTSDLLDESLENVQSYGL